MTYAIFCTYFFKTAKNSIKISQNIHACYDQLLYANFSNCKSRDYSIVIAIILDKTYTQLECINCQDPIYGTYCTEIGVAIERLSLSCLTAIILWKVAHGDGLWSNFFRKISVSNIWSVGMFWQWCNFKENIPIIKKQYKYKNVQYFTPKLVPNQLQQQSFGQPQSQAADHQ